jgi:hypothetical protein
MQPCRTYWEDIAVTEPMDTQFDMVYRTEFGTVQRNEVGQEDIEQLTKSMRNEIMKKSAHKEEISDYFEQIDTTETNRQKINVKTKEHREEKGWSFSGGIKGSVGEGGGG